MAQFSPTGVPLPTPKPLQSGAQAGTPQPDSSSDLRTGWQEFLSHPENRAGLLQFGLSMLNPPNPGGSLASNIGGSLSEGMAARGAAIAGQQATDAAQSEAELKMMDLQSKLELRRAQTARALRPDKSGSGGAKGALTQKDYAKEWVKYVKDRRGEDADVSIAELRQEFNEIWSEASGTSEATPAAGGVNAAAINQMTLEQLMALDRTKLDSASLQAASARYQQLNKAK